MGVGGFYDNFFDTKCPGLKEKKIDNNILCQHGSLLRQRYCAAYDMRVSDDR
jgi:hypothetical protein